MRVEYAPSPGSIVFGRKSVYAVIDRLLELMRECRVATWHPINAPVVLDGPRPNPWRADTPLVKGCDVAIATFTPSQDNVTVDSMFQNTN